MATTLSSRARGRRHRSRCVRGVEAERLYQLKKNANYWRKGLPAWDRLVVKIIPEDAHARRLPPDGKPTSSARRRRANSTAQDHDGHHRRQVRPWAGFHSVFKHPKAAARRPEFPQGGLLRHRPQDDRARTSIYGLMDPTAVPAPPRVGGMNAEADKDIAFDLDKGQGLSRQVEISEWRRVRCQRSRPSLIWWTPRTLRSSCRRSSRSGIKINLKVYEFRS